MLSEVKTHEGTTDYKTGSECSGLINYFQSSRLIIPAFIFKSIFDIVEPVSKVLQARDLDILAAVSLLTKAETRIKNFAQIMLFLKFSKMLSYTQRNNLEILRLTFLDQVEIEKRKFLNDQVN